MSLTNAEVKKIAHLARLDIDGHALDKYATELSAILDLVAQMDQVATEHTAPAAHPYAVHQRLRPDAVTETDQHVLFQSIAPQVEADLYLVPQVIEE